MPYANREVRNVKQRERYASDPAYREYFQAHNKIWREANADKVRDQKFHWRERNKDHVRLRDKASKLLRDFGITIQQWQDIFDAQGQCCAACGSLHPRGQWWHTDHNPNLPKGHPKYIRGILCGGCNMGIGLANENIAMLKKWIAYLETHS